MMTRRAAVGMMCNSIYWLLFVGAEACMCVCVSLDANQADSKCQSLSVQRGVSCHPFMKPNAYLLHARCNDS